MTKRMCIGFDIRLRLELQEANAAPRSQFLKLVNQNPISVDSRAWATTEEIDSVMQDPSQAFWTPFGLASNLDLLLIRCSEDRIKLDSVIPACFTVRAASRLSLIERYGARYFPNDMDEDKLIENGWRFMGLDTVQLNGFTSGLKGIGYKEPSWSTLREQFGEALNDVGLFADAAIAERFAEVRGKEVPAHSPLEVVGILIRDSIST